MEPGPGEGGTPGRALLTFHTLAAAATGGRGASTFPARTGIRSLHLLVFRSRIQFLSSVPTVCPRSLDLFYIVSYLLDIKHTVEQKKSL